MKPTRNAAEDSYTMRQRTSSSLSGSASGSGVSAAEARSDRTSPQFEPGLPTHATTALCSKG
eukprot:6959682-Prymnesium_polylepis.1